MSRTVLVTGASGFIGRSLVRRLVRAGYRVRAAVRDPGAISDLPAEAVRIGDLAGEVDWRGLVAGADSVVHLAGIAHAREDIPEARYQRVNADAVEQLARASAEAGVRRLLLVSSVRAQTGPAAKGLVDERREPVPSDAYGRSKLAAEQGLARALAGHATDWVALRPVVLYGPGVKGNVAALAKLAATGLPLPLGGLAGRRSLLGLVNFSNAVDHALFAEGASRRVFLVADPEPVTVADVVTALRRARGISPRILGVPEGVLRATAGMLGQAPMLDRLSGDLVVDTTALQSTGWCPIETAREGLERWVREGLHPNPAA